MPRTIYLAVEINSPELQPDCGAYNLIGAFEDYDKAVAARDAHVEADKEFGFYPVDVSKDSIVSYKNGDEDSNLWSEYYIEKTVLR